MYTSGIDMHNRKLLKGGVWYLAISIFCIAFGAIYEHYSYEVYSYYMIYAFVFPLIGGVLPCVILFMKERGVVPSKVTCNVYNSGIATFTVGCLVKGALDIYGTTNDLIHFYWYVGTLFCLLGLVLYAKDISDRKKSNSYNNNKIDPFLHK